MATYEDIAMDYSLWAMYVDPHATMTEETFNSMTVEEKIELQKRLFGPEYQEVQEDGFTMKLNVFTVNDIRKLRPCYDPVSGMDQDGNVVHPGGFVSENWVGTALDVLKIDNCPAEDRLWLVLRDQWIDNRTLRLFAVWCARRALQTVDDPDQRSITACDTAERFAHGAATAKELAAAWEAAKDVAWDSTWGARAAAEAAARSAVKAAWTAARSAAEQAVEAAARAVRVAAWNDLRPAAWTAGWTGARAARAAAREEQIRQLIKMLEAED